MMTCCTAGGIGEGGTGVAGKGSVITQSKKLDKQFFLALHPYPLFLCVDGSREVLTAMPDSAYWLK